MTRYTLSTILFAGWILAACTQGPVSEPPVGTSQRDSAGVVLVDLGRSLDPLLRPERVATSVFVVGDTTSDVELFRVTSGRFLPDGSLAVGNSGSYDVLVFGRSGELLRRLGRQGEGPGEFGAITSLHVGPGDSLTVFDRTRGRLSLWEGGEVLAATRGMAESSNTFDVLTLAGSFQGPNLAVVSSNRRFVGEGLQRDTTPLLRFSPGSTRPDTLARWPTRLAEYTRDPGGGWSVSFIGLGPDLLTAGNHGYAALADTHGSEVAVYSAHGLQTLIRWTAGPRKVEQWEREDWLEGIAAQREAAPPELREILEQGPLPRVHDTYPLLRGIALSSEDEVWIAPTEMSKGDLQFWFRVGAGGEQKGSVALPRDLEILDVADGQIATLRRTELGLEVVEVFEILGPSR